MSTPARTWRAGQTQAGARRDTEVVAEQTWRASEQTQRAREQTRRASERVERVSERTGREGGHTVGERDAVRAGYGGRARRHRG